MLPFTHAHLDVLYYICCYIGRYVYNIYVTLLCEEYISSGKRRLKSLRPEIFQIRGEHNIIIINGRRLNVSTHRAVLCENEKRAVLYTDDGHTHLRRVVCQRYSIMYPSYSYILYYVL